MLLSYIAQAAIDWGSLFGSVCGPLGFPCPCNTDGFLGFGARLQCPGAAFSPIAAAYQTQGMWVQADLLNQIRFSGLGSLAAVLYMLSAIGGMIGVALGAPPKMYLWFFMGPPVYHWLVGASYPVKGTEWRVADIAQDQRKVWELAEVGLVNSNWIQKSKSVYRDSGPSATVNVSWAYAYFDHLVSSVVQNLTAWTGLYNMRGSTQGIRSGIGPAPASATGYGKMKNSWVGDRWWLLSNSKWGMIENITNAKIASPKIRDALATFMASECGDALMKEMNSSSFLNAMYHKGRSSPTSIFQTSSMNQNQNFNLTGNPSVDYEPVFRSLAVERVPMPRSLRDVLKERPDDRSSLAYSLGLHSGAGEAWRLQVINSPWLECPIYLQVLMEAFRWEAGQIYHQFVASAPPGINEDWLGYYLLYGWNIRKKPLNFVPPADSTEEQVAQSWPHLNDDERREFMKNLIFVHLVRNEMMIMPANFVNRKNSATQTEESSEGHLRFIAIKNKFPELYQWALMVPHMQGILLYYLTLAFPFCAMMVVVPGYHKVTFTWMTFWMWTKLWDFGFAMVTSLERSVWAMIGNKAEISGNLSRIAEMSDWGRGIVSACKGGNCNINCLTLSDSSCQYANVSLHYGAQSLRLDQASYDTWAQGMRFFDRALTMAANLDLDLSNSYYVYIMAGLYFSVPVVVGQVVLGAKAGSASLVSNIIGAVGQEAGRQGAAGHQSDMIYRMKAAKAAVGQEAYAKGLRANGLMDEALGYANQNLMMGLSGSALGQAAKGASAVSQMMNVSKGLMQSSGELAGRAVQAGGVLINEGLIGGGMGIAGVNRQQLWNPRAGTPTSPGFGFTGESGRPSTDARGGNTDRLGLKSTDSLVPGATSNVAGIAAANVNNGGSVEGTAAAAAAAAAGTMFQVGGGASESSRGGGFARAISAAGHTTQFITDQAPLVAGFGNYRASVMGAEAENAAQVFGVQAGIQSWGMGQQGTLLNVSDGRVGQQAEYEAKMAAWDAENAYSNQFAAMSTALGFFAGGLEAGSKPVDRMGMAMTGDLGTNTQAAARSTLPGSWMWGRVSDTQSFLNNNYGAKAVNDAFFVPGVWTYGTANLVEGAGVLFGGGPGGEGFPNGEQARSLKGTKAIKPLDEDQASEWSHVPK